MPDGGALGQRSSSLICPTCTEAGGRYRHISRSLVARREVGTNKTKIQRGNCSLMKIFHIHKVGIHIKTSKGRAGSHEYRVEIVVKVSNQTTLKSRLLHG